MFILDENENPISTEEIIQPIIDSLSDAGFKPLDMSGKLAIENIESAILGETYLVKLEIPDKELNLELADSFSDSNHIRLLESIEPMRGDSFNCTVYIIQIRPSYYNESLSEALHPNADYEDMHPDYY